MLLQDQRDLQQHAIVIHDVELSDEAISLVSLSEPSLHAWFGFCSSIPQQCNLFIIKSSRGIFPHDIFIYGDHHNYECNIACSILQVDLNLFDQLHILTREIKSASA